MSWETTSIPGANRGADGPIELAALADGSLSPKRKRRLEATLERRPDLAEALARQQAAIEAVRSIAIPAPARLHARIEGQCAPRLPQRRRLALGGAVTAATGALAVALVLALGRGAGTPTVQELAALSTRPATGPAPAPAPGQPKLLARRVAGVPFPNFRVPFGWKAAGQRSDSLDGRTAVTVRYRRGRGALAYTILSGAPLEPPGSATEVVRQRTQLAVLRRSSEVLVMWERGGHTCLLRGPASSRDELLALAAWRGDGAVPL